MIPRVCTVVLFLFIIFISPIVVLHQLGIKANFDPHTVTPTQIINYISTVNSPFLLTSHHHNKTKHTILGQHIHSPTQYVKKKKKKNLAAQHPQSSTHQTKATKPTFSKPPTLHRTIKKKKKKRKNNKKIPAAQPVKSQSNQTAILATTNHESTHNLHHHTNDPCRRPRASSRRQVTVLGLCMLSRSALTLVPSTCCETLTQHHKSNP